MGIKSSAAIGALVVSFAAMLSPALSAEVVETFDVDALPGKTILVHDRAYFDTDTCAFDGYPEFLLTTPPTKGVVSVEKVKFTLKKGACKGHEAEGLAINYTAAQGAKGTDTFSFHRVFEGVLEIHGDVTITIR